MTSFRSYFSTSHRNDAALTLDQLRNVAPSAFAEDKHESRSRRYTYIPTVTVVEALMNEGFQPFRAVQGTSRIEGKENFTKHMIRFRHESNLDMQVGDTFPEVVLINSHDGTSSFILYGGAYRKTCMNGMVVSDSTIDSIKIPHMGQIVDRVVEGSFQIVAKSRVVIDSAHEWGQLQLTTGEQNAFAEAAHELRFADAEGEVTTPIQPTQLLQPRRSADAGNDLWRTFNRVQENVIRGGLHGYQRDDLNRLRRVTTRQIKGIDQDVKLNRALWVLTEKMAELKGATVAA